MPQPKKADSESFPSERMVEAIKATNGRVYLAAKSIGCEACTIYRRAKKDEAVRKAIHNCRGEFLDAAETALNRAVLAGEAWAVCFTLKTLGKKRGFVERSEHEHSGTVNHKHSTVREVLDEIGNDEAYQEFCRTRAAGGDPSLLCYSSEQRSVDDSPTLSAHRPGSNGHTNGKNGKHPGH